MRQNDTSTTPDYGVDGSPIRVPLICIGLWVLTIALLVFSNPVLKGLVSYFWCFLCCSPSSPSNSSIT